MKNESKKSKHKHFLLLQLLKTFNTRVNPVLEDMKTSQWILRVHGRNFEKRHNKFWKREAKIQIYLYTWFLHSSHSIAENYYALCKILCSMSLFVRLFQKNGCLLIRSFCNSTIYLLLILNHFRSTDLFSPEKNL